MLQVPNAAAQLMAGPLFRCGVLCFEGGIGGDVLRLKGERLRRGKVQDHMGSER
jgi:hypothetical protein